jgi:hypothetical protein
MCFVSNLGMGAAHLPGYLAALKEESARNLSRIARTGSAGGYPAPHATVGRKGGGECCHASLSSAVGSGNGTV